MSQCLKNVLCNLEVYHESTPIPLGLMLTGTPSGNVCPTFKILSDPHGYKKDKGKQGSSVFDKYYYSKCSKTLNYYTLLYLK